MKYAVIVGIDERSFFEQLETIVTRLLEGSSGTIIFIGSPDNLDLSLYDEGTKKNYFGAEALSIIVKAELQKRLEEKEPEGEYFIDKSITANLT